MAPTASAARIDTAERGAAARLPTASVVICAYTESRWDLTMAAVNSVKNQTHVPEQCILVIDHNVPLYERFLAACPDAEVIQNTEKRGLSGARNSGVRSARGDVVAFLDDDSSAAPNWLAELLRPYEDPRVVGTGGLVRAAWPGVRPVWFPAEFDWVVGCSYAGLPEQRAPVRNPIGANMSFRRSVFGGEAQFDEGIGRLGTVPLGCEETMLSIRVRRANPNSTIVYVPEAIVDHAISQDRTRLSYFLRRCVAEGVSKAKVARLVGTTDALDSERSYLARTLPRAMGRHLYRGIVPSDRRLRKSWVRGMTVPLGALATATGYAIGRSGCDAFGGWLVRPRPKSV